jgi:hypothetical protein
MCQQQSFDDIGHTHTQVALFRQKLNIFILFQHHVWQHMSNNSRGQKFDMISIWLAKSSTCLLAPEHSLLVGCCLNLAYSANRKRGIFTDAKLEQGAGAALARSLETNVQKIESVWAKFDRPSTSSKQNPAHT